MSLLGAIAGLSVLVAPVSAVTGWTGPQAITSAACGQVSAAVDATGRYHVAANCSGQVRYSRANPNGSWSTTAFAHPSANEDVGPIIAIDGNKIYVAFSRVTPLDCGVSHVGVYYRSKPLTGGSWSAATLLGPAGEQLQSFRVVGGKIHATVSGRQLRYQTLAGGILKRYLLAGGGSHSSLRIGSDGRARIVYEVANGLRFAVFNGTAFTTSSIPGTTSTDQSPQLVLDSQNKASIVWTQEAPTGCGGPGTSTGLVGTHFGTNRTGSWTPVAARRFTTNLGPAALALDAASGRAYVLVAGASGLRYYTKPATGAWSSQTLSSAQAQSVSIRHDPGSGKVLAVFSMTKIWFLTKP